MAKKRPVNEATHNQLRFTEKRKIPIGAIPYWGNSLGKTPLFLNYAGNEEFWDNQEQIVISQNEFNSLDIGYMFYKDPALSKENPYIYKDAWVKFGKEENVVKKPLAAFQQLHHDCIRCKIISDGETIDAIKALVKWEDTQDILHLFDLLENYNVQLNTPRRYRKKVISTKGSYEIEATIAEDYDFDNDLEEISWNDVKTLQDRDKEWHRNYWRLEKLQEKYDTYKGRIRPNFKKFAKVLINAYPELKLYEALPEDIWTFGPQDLRRNMPKLVNKYQTTYTSIWQTWYNHVLINIEKEIKELEKYFQF